MNTKWTYDEMTAWIDTLTEREALVVYTFAVAFHAMGHSKEEALCMVREEMERAYADMAERATVQ